MLNLKGKDVNDKMIEISAKTVEEAIELGLAELEASRDQVEIEVVKEGKRGVFGLGSEEALVRLSLKETLPVAATVEIKLAATPEDQPLKVETPETSPSARPAPQPEGVEAIAINFLQGLLGRMGIDAIVTARLGDDLTEPDETPPLVLDISGADLGILIGRRSETLRALQYMVRLMVSKQLSRWYPITIDVESYRVRRRNSLHQLALKMAERAISSRRQVVMEAMPAYERRIIHLALRDHPAVLTKSVGSDENRKVTIIPK
jgi:spoIIIJ-associated protein